jgi:hypothetical protein
MSQNSAKQIYTQLTEWVKTMKPTTRSTPKTVDKAPQDYSNVRIKNGPNGRR